MSRTMTVEQARESTDPKVVQALKSFDALKFDSTVQHSVTDLHAYQVRIVRIVSIE